MQEIRIMQKLICIDGMMNISFNRRRTVLTSSMLIIVMILFPLDDNSCASAVDLSILPAAVDIGAVCLDGSPPAYNWDKGSGTGKNRWLVHLEGGGWCESNVSCAQRSGTYLGSSNHMNKTYGFSGILSESPTLNPYFYNWNRVLLRYCDGGSFAGNVDSPVSIDIPQQSKPIKLYYRGQRIWKALVEHLLLLGMNSADKALLAGTSAGGLASLIHCNSFRELLPTTIETKCLSDAGFFIDVEDVSGKRSFQKFFTNVVELQNVSGALPSTCINKSTPTQCFFPSELIQHIESPFFILNAGYDSWQWNNVLVPLSADPNGTWSLCKSNPINCSTKQLLILQDFRRKMLEFLDPLNLPLKSGLFLISCFYHNIAFSDLLWDTNFSKINDENAAKAMGEWYFDGKNLSILDCAYPCNVNCKGPVVL